MDKLERKVLLKGPLAWDPNRELDKPDPEIQQTEQQFKTVFDQYIGQVVLVQGIDNNCRLRSGDPENARLFILQHGILAEAKRRERGRGSNFYLGFDDGKTAYVGCYGWAGYLRVLNFIGSEISRVIGSRGEIIYEDSTESEKWDKFYKIWYCNGELPDKYSEEPIGSLQNLTRTQIFNREIQKAVSASLLISYRVFPQ